VGRGRLLHTIKWTRAERMGNFSEGQGFRSLSLCEHACVRVWGWVGVGGGGDLNPCPSKKISHVRVRARKHTVFLVKPRCIIFVGTQEKKYGYGKTIVVGDHIMCSVCSALESEQCSKKIIH
jgi:hypothetical protein